MMVRRFTFFLLACGFGHTLSAQIGFTNVTGTYNIVHDYGASPLPGATFDMGGGATFCDYDKDGLDDLVLTTANGTPAYIYHNTGSGFVYATPGPIAVDSMESKQALWADYDNDGDRDFFLTNLYFPPALFRNDNGVFVNVTGNAGLPGDPLEAFGAAWGDYDRDGWLDLFICNYTVFAPGANLLFHNNGDGTFTDVSVAAGIQDSAKRSFQATFLDYDNDSWPDIYVANDLNDGNTLFRNMGNGTFQDVSQASGARLEMYSMSVTVGDYDGNGYQDIYVTNIDLGNRLLQNQGNGTFIETAATAGVEVHQICWGANFFDADNDGDDDLFVSAAADTAMNWIPDVFYENDGAGVFTQRTGIGMDDPHSTVGTAIGDMNDDGYWDILVSSGDSSWSQLYRNNGGSHHYLKVDLEGVQSNREGIGVWIESISDSLHQHKYSMCGISMISQNSLSHIIGMRNDTLMDWLILKWPSGVVDSLKNIPADQRITVVEGEGNILAPAQVVPVTCPGDSNGSLSLSPAGGNGSFRYLWSTGDTTASLSNLPSGSYSVTISSGYACKVFSYTLTEPVLPVPVITVSADSLLAGPGSSYTWYLNGSPISGANQSWYIPTQTGVYQVLVTDSNGCAVLSDTLNLLTLDLKVPVLPALRIHTLEEGLYAIDLPAGSKTLLIHSMDGRTVRREELPGEALRHYLDLRGLPRGVWLLELRLPGGRAMKRLLR